MAVGFALIVVLAGLAGTMTVATQTVTTQVSIDATPTDPDESESTHAVVFTVGDAAGSAGSTFADIKVSYSASPQADVSNAAVERIGIDRGANKTGTRLDVNASVTEMSGGCDGTCVKIKTNQEHDINAGDEVVVVLQKVQNPQNTGTPDVDVVLNTQSAADTANDTVTYEPPASNVSLSDQESDGTSVTVEQANLSEGGWVVVQNKSGRNSDAVRGQTYVTAGNHSNVTVELDEPISQDQELVAQIYHETNGDLIFSYAGGIVDRPYEDADGNVQSFDSGNITVVESTPTPTPTESGTTATATSTDSSSDDDVPEISNYQVTADGSEITVSFDSDETLADIEVDVRGAEDATLHTEDFDGNEFEGYSATYQASADGDYTLELVTAEDGAANDGAEDGDYSGTVTVAGTGGDATATATPTEGDTTEEATATGTEADSDESRPADTESPTDADTGGDSAGESPTDDEAGGDEAAATDSPTAGDGPGFGGLIALVAVLGSALLFYRRR